MKSMALSNYEIMRNRMRTEFVRYDQERMIRKFHLAFDEAYLYLTFVCRDYRIDRRQGIVEWSTDGFQSAAEADYNESMTIYDVLCCSGEDCRLAGTFCPLHQAKGTPKTMLAGNGMFQKTAERFQGRLGQLEYACGLLGEPADMVGDVAAVLWAFPFLPVTLQYWEGDDEFSPSLKLMYDENILDYMHFETVYFMTAHLLKRIEETADAYVQEGQV